MKSVTLSLEEVKPWIEEIIATRFRKKQILGLVGPLGAGKTKLVEIALANLGVSDPVSSPTFSLINHYSTEKYPFIAHVDLYRTEGEEDLESTGFWDLFSEGKGLVLIEWADRIDTKDLPLDWDYLEIEITKPQGDEARSYRLKEA